MSTATLTRTEPKRWPINSEVIDSPACAMPQYAGYRRAFYLMDHSSASCSADTLADLLVKGVPWARESSRIVRVPMIPYYDHDSREPGSSRPVGSTPWAGGTWGGRCGSTIWVTDPDRRYRDAFATIHALGGGSGMQDDPLATYNVDKLQAWWVNGSAERHEHLDGFHVECQQMRREHGPLCTALDIEWNWRDYAPWTDQGHNTQITLF